VNAQCNIDCQARGEAQCEADVQGGCTAQCSKPSGALFCNGQFVETGDQIQSCIDALKAELNITVTADASGSCSGNSCEGTASASAKCALAEEKSPYGVVLFAGIACAVGVTMRRRRTARA
jgi:hypothetical protein